MFLFVFSIPVYAGVSAGGGVSTVNVNNFPTTYPISTTSSLSTIPAAGSTWPVSFSAASSQVITPQSGSVFTTVPAGSSTWPVSSGTIPWIISPISGTNYSTVPAGGSTWPISIASGQIASGNTVGVQGMASGAVIGHVIVDTAPTTAVTSSTIPWVITPISGTNFSTVPAGSSTWPVSASTVPWIVTPVSGTNYSTVPAGSSVWPVTAGVTTNKTLKVMTGTTTSSSTAYQQMLIYTTTTGKTFYIDSFVLEGRSTAATFAYMGTCSVEIPKGTSVATFKFQQSNSGAIDRIVVPLSEPIYATSTQNTALSCTPSGTTVFTWDGSLFGYEQ